MQDTLMVLEEANKERVHNRLMTGTLVRLIAFPAMAESSVDSWRQSTKSAEPPLHRGRGGTKGRGTKRPGRVDGGKDQLKLDRQGQVQREVDREAV